MCVYMYMYTCTHDTYIYICVYVYIYTHTSIHTKVCINIQGQHLVAQYLRTTVTTFKYTDI